MSTINEHDIDNIRVIELNHPNMHNPFSEQHESNIKLSLARANDDPKVAAVIVTGCGGKSFSAGGDFNEVKNLTGGADVDAWIDRVTDLYVSVLKVEKPTVAAISGYAIGMGFQFAMMFDWRIMTNSAEFRMPELKHGIGCAVGGEILSFVLDFSRMQDIIYSCESIDSQKALDYRLVKEVTTNEKLVERAIEVATMMAAYPAVPFRNTKRAVNSKLLEKLYETAEASKVVHRAAFAARSSQDHFRNILGDKYDQKTNRHVELTR